MSNLNYCAIRICNHHGIKTFVRDDGKLVAEGIIAHCDYVEFFVVDSVRELYNWLGY